MARYSSGNNQPLTHWNNLPIYLTTILTAVFVLGLIVSAVFTSLNSPLLGLLVFEMPLRPEWSLWRLFTYVFIGRISFFTPFSILFFYWLGVGVETHLGRVVLSRLLILITLVTPAMAALWWWSFGVPFNSYAIDNYMLMSGLLVTFATLYPTTEAWGWIPFKWVAFACIVCGSLMLLAGRDWLGLSQLWASCAVAFAYTRHALELGYDDYESPFSRIQTWFRRRKFRVVRPGDAASSRRSEASESGPAEEMDRLLDKIAKSGISSLSSAERSRLEKARQALLKREGR
ncbi:MAG: DUF6576 domain-containing protein [Chthoniobacteraceae bacterium]